MANHSGTVISIDKLLLLLLLSLRFTFHILHSFAFCCRSIYSPCTGKPARNGPIDPDIK